MARKTKESPLEKLNIAKNYFGFTDDLLMNVRDCLRVADIVTHRVDKKIFPKKNLKIAGDMIGELHRYHEGFSEAVDCLREYLLLEEGISLEVEYHLPSQARTTTYKGMGDYTLIFRKSGETQDA